MGSIYSYVRTFLVFYAGRGSSTHVLVAADTQYGGISISVALSTPTVTHVSTPEVADPWMRMLIAETRKHVHPYLCASLVSRGAAK